MATVTPNRSILRLNRKVKEFGFLLVRVIVQVEPQGSLSHHSKADGTPTALNGTYECPEFNICNDTDLLPKGLAGWLCQSLVDYPSRPGTTARTLLNVSQTRRLS